MISSPRSPYARLWRPRAATIASLAAILSGCDPSPSTPQDSGSDLGVSDASQGVDGGALDVVTSDLGNADAGADVVVDAGVDAGADVAVDAGVDAGADVAVDAGVDAGADVAVDAGVDAGADAAVDAGVDAGADVAVDAGADVTVDVGVDAGADVVVDAGVDAGADAAVDAGADVAAPLPPQRSCAEGVTPGCGLVALQGGSFNIGTETQCFTNPDATCGYSAAPTQTNITVGPFAIDAYEVTVARFNQYWIGRAQNLAAVRGQAIAYPGGQIAWAPAPFTSPIEQGVNYNWSPMASARDAHPINGVDYWMAQEFCVWDGGRLPTEAEWEYVARGAARAGLAAGRLYPWGDEPPSATCDRARWNNTACATDDGARTLRVGRLPSGAAGGVFDLAGNVWEWVADEFTGYAFGGDPDPCNHRTGSVNPLCDGVQPNGARVIRGGAWGDTNVANLRSATRGSFNPTVRSFNIGFRCARTLAR